VLEFNVQVTGKIFGLRAGDPSGYSRPRAAMRGKIFSVSLQCFAVEEERTGAFLPPGSVA